MDVIDLRQNDWKSRREEIVMPTTIDQIREEVNRDEQERELNFKPKLYVTANAQASQRNWRKQGEGLGKDFKLKGFREYLKKILSFSLR